MCYPVEIPNLASGVFSPKPLFDDSKKVVYNPLNLKYNDPKPLFGGGATIRKRIEVTIDELRKYLVTTDSNLRAAHQSILFTNLDTITIEDILAWGIGEQEEHKQILESILKLFHNTTIKDSKNVFIDVIEKIKELDPSGLFPENVSFLNKLLTSQSDRESNYSARFLELSSIGDKLKSKLPEIFGIKKLVNDLKKQIAALHDKLDIVIVSSSFFAEYKHEKIPSELFISRVSSLLSTKVALKSNDEQANTFNESLITLVDNIQNILLTDVSMYYTNLLSALNSKNKGAVESLKTQQQQILDKLEKLK